MGSRLLSTLRLAWEGEGARRDTEPSTWTPGGLPSEPGRPLLPLSTHEGGPGRLGLTCPVVQEADASVVMSGDGEGLAWMTHHLVDLGWA